MPRRFWVLISGMLLATAACGSGRAPGPTGEPVRVDVTNNYALPLDIFAIGSSITHRLGVVYPGVTGRFNLPPAMIGNGSVEFQARPSAPGAQQARSGALLLDPGDIVTFVITPQLFNSTATVRRP